MKNFKKLIKEALTPHYLRESINEDIQPLAVEKLTDKALLDMLNNIDDMSRDKKGGTYDMSGRKMTSAQYDLAKSVEAEVRRREKERGLKIHYVDNERYEFMESVNEVKTESELKDAWREWNKKHPKDQIDWNEYREEHGEHLDEVTQ